jgi:hypothetical protein
MGSDSLLLPESTVAINRFLVNRYNAVKGWGGAPAVKLGREPVALTSEENQALPLPIRIC